MDSSQVLRLTSKCAELFGKHKGRARR